jgi:acyl-CoA reductase-like NAD-dependent aldehyde dehydrogenase
VIVKPSEVVPETGALLIQILQSVLPPGVLQVAIGDGSVGAQLVSDPQVAMIAMTGSSATGQKILQAAAPQMKRLVLELGGKDPMIVMDDADLDLAARDAVEYSLCNSGQVCCSIERIYVAAAVYDEFQTLTTKYAKDYKVGNGMDPDVKVGPLVSSVQRDLVKKQVDDAILKGAKVLHQSTVPPPPSESSPTTETCFYPVTVLANVTEDMAVFADETFGPIVAMTQFDGSEEEAIRLANDTEYGLASCVYTQDMEKAQRIAQRIDAGQVGINCYSLGNMDVNCPWYVRLTTSNGEPANIRGMLYWLCLLGRVGTSLTWILAVLFFFLIQIKGGTQKFRVRISFWSRWFSPIFHSKVLYLQALICSAGVSSPYFC